MAIPYITIDYHPTGYGQVISARDQFQIDGIHSEDSFHLTYDKLEGLIKKQFKSGEV